ncbi:hypothetical protein [Streptomyces mirabilis]|uniref:hypothetical protein n=1 Tax=Streptomyces mirabilis TaxID=68239 RepID=UPI003323ACC6
MNNGRQRRGIRFGRLAQLSVAAALIATSACSATTNTPDGAGQPTGPSAIPAKDGPGVTKSKIIIADESVTLDSPDIRRVRDAIVAGYNDAGGITGRRIEIVPSPADSLVKAALQSRDAATGGFRNPVSAEAVCEAYRSSRAQPLAVINTVTATALLGTPATASCLSKAGIVTMDGSSVTGDPPASADYRNAPFHIEPAKSFADRRVTELVAGARADGLFNGKPKAAILYDGSYPEKLINTVALPALAKEGITDPLVVFLGPGNLVPAPKAQVSSAVLKLKTADVNLVLDLADTWFGSHLPVMVEQKYFPTVIARGRTAAAEMSPGQVPGLTQKFADKIHAYSAYAGPTSRADAKDDSLAQRCISMLRPTDSGRLPLVQVAFEYCQQLEILKTALDASDSRWINAEAFLAGLTKHHTFPGIGTYGDLTFSPTKRDGISVTRRLDVDMSCTCVKRGPDLITF